MKKHKIDRRAFLVTAGAATAGALVAGSSKGSPARSAPRRSRSNKTRVALVGTGIRGTGLWGRTVVRNYSDVVDYVGMCDVNQGRLEYARNYTGANCPTYLDFDRMMAETKPDVLIVTTMDSNHHEFIIKALEQDVRVITEKPMTIDERKCQAILDAERASSQDVIVTFNYRYSPHRAQMKEMLMEGRIGEVTSVDFHWYLDTDHGASYFRRWHGQREYSGTLLVHKSTHHFDLLNWWLDSEPEVVYAQGALDLYGHNNEFRHSHCRTCPYQGECDYYFDITQDERLMNLYVDHEDHDGYLRDRCLWRENINIYDKMGVQARYANGVQVSYSLTTYSPYEGYRIAFNGTAGRMEAWIQEAQPWEVQPYDEIRVTDNFGDTHLIQVSHEGGGHGGGDSRLLDRIFRHPEAPDPLQQGAGSRDGAMSILLGIAARKSVEKGMPIRVAGLTDLQPRARRP